MRKRILIVILCLVSLWWGGWLKAQEVSFALPPEWTPMETFDPRQKAYAYLIEGGTAKAELIFASEYLTTPMTVEQYLQLVRQNLQVSLQGYTPQETNPFQYGEFSGLLHKFLFTVPNLPQPLQGITFVFLVGNEAYTLYFGCFQTDFARLEGHFTQALQNLKMAGSPSLGMMTPSVLPSPQGITPTPGGLPSLVSPGSTPPQESQGGYWVYQSAQYSFRFPLPPGSVLTDTLDNGAMYKTPTRGEGNILFLALEGEGQVQEVAHQVTQGKQFHGASQIPLKSGGGAQVSLYSATNLETNVQYVTLIATFVGKPLLVVIVIPAEEYNASQGWITDLFTQAEM